MEFEAKIPLALDPSDITVSIDEAYEKPRYYRCIKCHDYLQVRHGDIRAWYFAHYPQNTGSPECSLRTVGGIEELIEELRTSPIEKYEMRHRLRIAIIPDTYTGIAKVVALIHNPFSEMTDNIDNVISFMNTLNLNGTGLLNGFDKRIFHPSNPIVKLELDPDCTAYNLDFESSLNLEGLSGSWDSKGISTGDLFAGNRGIFERIEDYRKISESASFFEVSDTAPKNSGKNVLRVGKKFAIEKKIDELTNTINESNKGPDISLKSFEVDIIEPLLSDPWGDDIIYGLPNSKALLAIRPRKGLDPEFEIVTVPMKKDSITKIERQGKDKIRYHWIQFPSFGSNRITIHHADSHVFLHFFAKDENFEKIDLDLGKTIIGINYINNEGKLATVYPWQNRTIYLKRAQMSKVKVFLPEEFSIGIEIEALKDALRLPVKKSIKIIDLTNSIDMLIEEGFMIFILKFKGFGSTRIIVSETPKKMDLADISEKIGALGIDLHTRVSWDLIRRICDVPPGTPHKNLHEILTPKMARRALKLLKKGGKSND